MRAIDGVLIDLGEVRDGAAPAADGPAVPYRAVLAFLSVLLVVLLGGSVPRLRPIVPTIIPARLGDTVVVSDGRMYVATAGPTMAVRAFELPSARPIGTTTVTETGTVTQAFTVGSTLLLGFRRSSGSDQVVVALAAGTNRELWRMPAWLLGVSPVDGVALINTDGAAVAIEPATGRARWVVHRPSNGYVGVAGGTPDYPAWLITATDSGRLETYDAHTGALLATASVPSVSDRLNSLAWPAGDVMLVGDDGFRLPDLTRLWTTTTGMSQSWIQSDCGRVICTLRYRRGLTLTALDRATGRELWSSERWTDASAVGDHLLATLADRVGTQPPLWVLDPATGRELGDFGAWRGLGPAGPGLLYGMRDAPGNYAIWYGVLDPATRKVRLLGSGRDVSGDCRTSTGVLICRLIGASVAVWPLG